MTGRPVTLAIDGMGGDHAPHEVVAGAVEAASRLPVNLILVGVDSELERELALHNSVPANIEIVHANDIIGMDEGPAKSLRAKADSSIAVSARLVAEGRADGFISAGNTGAAMASALLALGRLPGISRPAIGVMLPAIKRPVFMLDVGANSDCRPEHLLQFAVMGTAYVHGVLGIEHPSVGLLSIGEESGKGNDLAQEAYRLLEASQLNFIGNVEGRDIPHGESDIVVTDGFTGNVVLKLMEGMGDFFLSQLRERVTADFRGRLGAAMVKPHLQSLRRRVDPEQYGGAQLLGVDGLCIITHGCSSRRGISQAVEFAYRAVREEVLAGIQGSLERIHQRQKGVSRTRH